MKATSLWFDGGGRHGFGNIRRSLELGRRLARLGLTVELRPLSAEAAKLAGCPFGTPGARSEIVVLDVPYRGDAWLASARELGARVLALDYEGATAPDLVVSLQAVRPLPPGTRHRVGLDYAIIRSEFLEAIPASPQADGPALVMLGGGASAELTTRITRQVAALADTVVLVQGPLASPIGAAMLPSSVRVVCEPDNLVALIAGCSWAVTTGGTALLEFVHLGRAVHALPRTPAEAAFAGLLAARSALLGIGEKGLKAPTPAQRDHCAQTGPRLIDGRGCERIAELIQSLP